MTKKTYEVSNNSFIAFAVGAGHKLVMQTTLFGKEYLWMKDTLGNHYLELNNG